jgi:hypothetical protein
LGKSGETAVDSQWSTVNGKRKQYYSKSINHRPSTISQPKATRETLLAYMQIEAAKVLGLEAGQKVDVNKAYQRARI